MQYFNPMTTPMTSKLKKLHDSTSCSKTMDTILYRLLIGSLMYSVHTRPHICYAVSALSEFMSEPKNIYWIAAKHVLRSLRGTIPYGINYTPNNGVILLGYADSDWEGSTMD